MLLFLERTGRLLVVDLLAKLSAQSVKFSLSHDAKQDVAKSSRSTVGRRRIHRRTEGLCGSVTTDSDQAAKDLLDPFLAKQNYCDIDW